MKKKILTVLSLIFISAIGAATFTACSCAHSGDSSGGGSDSTDSTGGSGSSVPVPDTYYAVTFGETEGVKIVCDDNFDSVKEGDSISFTVSVGAFYTGEPTVTANDATLEGSFADSVYAYTLTVNENTTIAVSGVSRAVSAMADSGSGAADEPFLIREPIDLLYMAEQVNAGYEAYVCGYYSLENSLDLKGEELEIIGNGSTQYSFFAGYLNGNGNTISNFVIDSKEYNYVGLFGIVQANLGAEDGAGGTIYGLNLKDYTIRAQSTGETLVCGSLVAEGFGANLYLCNAENGVIDLYSDQNNFAYVGGLIGVQQSFNAIEYGAYQYFSEIAYCAVDVEVNCNAGAVFAAGGIAGYTASFDATTVSSIVNSYFTGNVSGAIYTGGVVGVMGTYTGIANCYSTGMVNAQTNVTDNTNSLQFCYAYAGGIAAMAQSDSSITDCFATGEITAVAQLGKKYVVIGEILATMEEISETAYGSRPVTVYNCYYAKDGEGTDLKSVEFLRNQLGWNTIDWVFEEGKYPVVNTEASEGHGYTVVIDFGNVAVAGENEEDIFQLEIVLEDYYKPMTFWYQYGAIVETVMAKNGYSSYGYYFDEKHTMPVPYGYVPTRDITLYAAFANYGEVVGTYYVLTADPATVVTLVLREDGTFTCADPMGESEGTFVYNGDEIVFYGARFARYYGITSGLVQQQSYTFIAELTDQGLAVSGGVYTDAETSEETLLIPASAPLTAVRGEGVLTGGYYAKAGGVTTVYTFYSDGTGSMSVDGESSSFRYTLQGSALRVTTDSSTLTGTVTDGGITLRDDKLSVLDRYAGVWEMDSLSKKYYTFDGAGNWTYVYYGYRYDGASGNSFRVVLSETKGTYTLNETEETAELSDGTVVRFGENGLLTVTSAKGNVFTYGKEGSCFGVWTTSNGNTELTLYGVDENGAGAAKVSYISREEGVLRKETYYLDYYADVLEKDKICLYYDGLIYGILSCNVVTGRISGSLYSLSAEGYSDISLYRVDEYKGEWISDDPLFEIVDFNGYGNYDLSSYGGLALKGTLIIDGQSVSYVLEDSTLEGYFYYDGEVYSIVYDEATQTVGVSYGDKSSALERKDSFGGFTFVDDDGNGYVFDGKGNLSKGGVLSVTAGNGNAREYTYRVTEGGATVFEKNTATVVGNVSVIQDAENRSFYRLTLNGNAVTLGIKTAFTGSRSVSASYTALMEIGVMDLDYTMKGSIPLEQNGAISSVETTFTLIDNEYLVCEVNESAFYVLQVAEEEFIISSYLNWFNYDGYYGYAKESDELFGTWTDSLRRSFSFDGIGRSTVGMGMASSSANNNASTTEYYYHWFEAQECFVIINYTNGTAQRVDFCAVGTARSYTNADRTMAFTLTTVDPEDYLS